MEKQCDRLSFRKMTSAFEVLEDVSEKVHKMKKGHNTVAADKTTLWKSEDMQHVSTADGYSL